MSDLSVVGRLKLLEKQFVLDGSNGYANTVQMAISMIESLKERVQQMEQHNSSMEGLVGRQSQKIIEYQQENYRLQKMLGKLPLDNESGQEHLT